MYAVYSGEWEDVQNFWLWTLPDGRVFLTDCFTLASVAADYESLPGILEWGVCSLTDEYVRPTHPTPSYSIEHLMVDCAGPPGANR